MNRPQSIMFLAHMHNCSNQGKLVTEITITTIILVTNLNEGITMCLDPYYDINSVHQHNCSTCFDYWTVTFRPIFYRLSHTMLCTPWDPSFTAAYLLTLGTAVAQWLRCCATNHKVAGSIPGGVIGFFIDIKYFRSHYGPGVDSASNRKEYQEYFLGVKAAGV